MQPRSDSDGAGRLPWRADQPYQELPRLPPGVELETGPVLRACIGARAALAELKAAFDLVPDPQILLTCLPVLEAQASSEIENIVTTADELFRHLEADQDASPQTREALRYREALLEGFRALSQRHLGFPTAEQVCRSIKGVEMGLRKVPGTAIGNAQTGELIYTPPVGVDLLRELVSNWERFLHGQEALDPLVRMAVSHYQFEAIHPFTDGNGRTGRILNSLFLVERGLIGAPVLYLSRYIIAHKSDYYSRLLGVTKDRAFEPWLLYMLAAVEETSQWTLAKIQAIRSLLQGTREHVQSRLPKIYSPELVESVFKRPYCRIAHLVDSGIAQRQAAARYLDQLAEIGVLEARKTGRDKLFVNIRLLGLLTRDSNEQREFPWPRGIRDFEKRDGPGVHLLARLTLRTHNGTDI